MRQGARKDRTVPAGFVLGGILAPYVSDPPLGQASATEAGAGPYGRDAKLLHKHRTRPSHAHPSFPS